MGKKSYFACGLMFYSNIQLGKSVVGEKIRYFSQSQIVATV